MSFGCHGRVNAPMIFFPLVLPSQPRQRFFLPLFFHPLQVSLFRDPFFPTRFRTTDSSASSKVLFIPPSRESGCVFLGGFLLCPGGGRPFQIVLGVFSEAFFFRVAPAGELSCGGLLDCPPFPRSNITHFLMSR